MMASNKPARHVACQNSGECGSGLRSVGILMTRQNHERRANTIDMEIMFAQEQVRAVAICFPA